MQVAPPDITPANGFEGAEKKLEIAFHFTSDCKVGLRAVAAERWSTILDLVQCSIVSCTKNDHFDAYVLSESSLFVYPYKVVLKTCGRTVLLRCLEPFIQLAKEVCNVIPDFAFFSRKSFLYPDEQVYPHTSFEHEVEYLNRHFKSGHSYKLGPVDSDHTWHLYVCDLREREVEGDQTFEVMMTDLDPTVMKQFYKKEHDMTAQEVTVKSGIAELLPGSTTDPFLFSPCGYSVNGLLDGSYFTVHITPEPHCSFVSFETNAPRESFVEMAAKTLEVFKPGKATITLFADQNAVSGPSTFSALDGKKLLEHAGGKYQLSHSSFTQFEDPYDVTVLYLESKAQ
jgi:S-adenosylmethionine decarboxylase